MWEILVSLEATTEQKGESELPKRDVWSTNDRNKNEHIQENLWVALTKEGIKECCLRWSEQVHKRRRFKKTCAVFWRNTKSAN